MEPESSSGQNLRTFIVMVSCLLIWFGWLYLQGQQTPPPGTPAVPAPETDSREPPLPSTPGAPKSSAPSASAPVVEAVREEVIETWEAERFRGTLSTYGASLRELRLNTHWERLSVNGAEADGAPEDRKRVSLVSAKGTGDHRRQAVVRWRNGDSVVTPQLEFVERASDRWSLKGAIGDVGLTVGVRVREDTYALSYQLRARNQGLDAQRTGAQVEISLKLPEETGGGMFAPPANELNAVCYVDGDVEREGRGSLEDRPWMPEAAPTWAGIDRQYFVVAAAPQTPQPQDRCRARVEGGAIRVVLDLEAKVLAAGETWERTFDLFLGPKRRDELEKVHTTLREVIQYNVWGIPLAFLCRPMIYLLNVFHGWTASWGVAIMLLTVVVKVLLFPVTYKSAVSMRRMQLLKPELDALRERFKDDPQRQQMEQMKLFKEKDVSLFGGCLPMLLQMPVWFALYRALWSAVDLYQQSFLWLSDLTAPESGIPWLSIGVGALMYLQQVLTPMSSGATTEAAQMQMKIMRYGMPAFMVFIMYQLPSGLVFYVCVNSIVSIVQQFVINKRTVAL